MQVVLLQGYLYLAVVNLQVRCLVDHGEFETQDGANILLKKNSQVSMCLLCKTLGKLYDSNSNKRNFSLLLFIAAFPGKDRVRELDTARNIGTCCSLTRGTYDW